MSARSGSYHIEPQFAANFLKTRIPLPNPFGAIKTDIPISGRTVVILVFEEIFFAVGFHKFSYYSE